MSTLTLKSPRRELKHAGLRAALAKRHASTVNPKRSAKEWAIEQFPVFRIKPPVPLALNTRAEMEKRHTSDVEGLGRFLYLWTSRKAYKQAVAAEGSKRHDLDGNPVEDVSVDHRKAAQKALGE
jgi:hypothetical protein